MSKSAPLTLRGPDLNNGMDWTNGNGMEWNGMDGMEWKWNGMNGIESDRD